MVKNEKIEQARQTALALLKPSQKELEHGLELHADSIVFDSYGFSPTAALDTDVLAKAMAEGASNLELQDLHEDMSMTRKATDPVERKEFMDAWDASGVTCVFQNAGEEGQSIAKMCS